MRYFPGLLLFIALLLPVIGAAQSFTVPEDVSFESAEDYRAQHENILAAIDWLQTNKVDHRPEKRKAINAYVLTFLTGSPDVSIVLGDLALYEDCADCMMAFMTGWTRYAIEGSAFEDAAGGKLAGVRNLIDFYNRNRPELGAIKKIDKMKKLEAKGKLEKWVAKQS